MWTWEGYTVKWRTQGRCCCLPVFEACFTEYDLRGVESSVVEGEICELILVLHKCSECSRSPVTSFFIIFMLICMLSK